MLAFSGHAQNIIVNPGFEEPGTGGEIKNWSAVEGWSSTSLTSGIDDKELYSPVDGRCYAFLRGSRGAVYQSTGHPIRQGQTYQLKLWARSINPAGVTDRVTLEVSLRADTNVIAAAAKNLNAPQLKGAAADCHNDDGANVWIDGNYRHQFSHYHMVQPLSADPVDDPWRLVEDSPYRNLDSLGWAVGQIIAQGNKYIYGTLYRDVPGNFYSSITMTSALSREGVRYQWSDPVTLLSHKGSEFPWVLDAHCYYDEATGKMWMSWGGGTCYVTEMDPDDGKMMAHPESTEFDTHPRSMHTPVAKWPETRQGWCGDEWSRCWMEGPALYKHNGYWYFFASYGNLSEDYTIRCGRGKSPTGPFYDKQGQDLTEFDRQRNEYGNTILLGEQGEQLVPGHPHIWEEDGKYYMGYDFRKHRNRDRDYMGIRRIYWVGGWPTIYTPVTVTFDGGNYPGLAGENLDVYIRNTGEENGVVAVDHVSLKVMDKEERAKQQ